MAISRGCYVPCLLAAAVMLAAGCNSEKPSLEVPRKPSEPMTAAEAEKVGRSIEQAIAKSDSATYNNLVDLQQVVERALSGLKLNDSDRRGLMEGMQRSGGLYTQIQTVVKQGGSYKFLRARKKKEGEYSVLFRMLLPENGGVNYHDVLLAKRNGVIASDDIYVFLSGELLSTTLRRMLIPLAAQQNRGLLSRLSEKEREFIKHIRELQQMMAHVKSRQSARALSVYRSLPESVRQGKIVMLLRLQAAIMGNDNREYVAAFNDYRTLFPEDVSVDVLAIDAFFIRKEYDKALASIDRAEKQIGGDPHMDVLRSSVYVQKQECKKARDIAEKAIKAEPEMVNAHWARANAAIGLGQHEEVLGFFKQMDRRFQLQWADFRTLPVYASFVKSPQYKQWLQYLSSKR